MPSHIVIVGASLAGLTAAYRLKQAGHTVQIMERRARAGGRLYSVDWQGFRFDPVTRLIGEADRALFDLLDELDLSEALIPYGDSLTLNLFRDEAIHTTGFLDFKELSRWDGLSLRGRLGVNKLLSYLKGTGHVESLYHLEQAEGPDNETCEEFLYKRVHPELYLSWAGPVLSGWWGYDGGGLSRKAFLALILSLLDSDTFIFQDGFSRLLDALHSFVTVDFNTQVEGITLFPDGSGVLIDYLKGDQPASLTADRVVVAVNGKRVLPLFSGPRPAWSEFFQQVTYQPIAIYCHLLHSDFAPPVRDLYFSFEEGFPLSQITFDRWQDGRWLIITRPNPFEFDWNIPDADYARRVEEALYAFFPDLTGRFIAHQGFKWRNGILRFPPEYLAALARFKHQPEENPVYFCGDYLTGPLPGGAIYSAELCVEQLLADL